MTGLDETATCRTCGGPIYRHAWKSGHGWGAWMHVAVDHRAEPEQAEFGSSNIEPSSCAADARTTRQPPVHSAGSPRPSAPAEPSGPPGAETRPRPLGVACMEEGPVVAPVVVDSHTCATCGDPIVLDRVFGWLHTDRPDGQSHNHDAQP